MSYIIDLLILVLILVFAFVTVSAEIALLQIKTSQVPSNDKFAMRMVTHKSEFLSTIQVGITLSSLLAGYAGEPAMTRLISFLPLPEHILAIVSFVLVTYISIVLSELLPKNVAMAYTQETLKRVALPIKLIYFTFYPMVWLLDKSSQFLSHLFHIPVVNEQDELYTQEQLIAVASRSANHADSDLSQNDAKWLKRAVRLDNQLVREVMTPRQNINHDGTRYSRIPSASLTHYEYRGMTFDLETIDSFATVNEALAKMTATKSPILVVTENESAVGIVTKTDIYSQIFDDLADEKDR